jgi:hypothetical protein
MARHNEFKLVFSIKDKGTFRLARWLKEYAPDLSILSKPPNDSNQMASCRILTDFPHSQHRPVILEYGLKIPIIRLIPKPRWNFKNANWTEFAKKLDHLIIKSKYNGSQQRPNVMNDSWEL